MNVSISCAGEYVGMEEIDDGVWTIYFGPLNLGRLLERHMRIEDEFGRLKRKKCNAFPQTFLLSFAPTGHAVFVTRTAYTEFQPGKHQLVGNLVRPL